jgi:hypothetical protein
VQKSVKLAYHHTRNPRIRAKYERPKFPVAARSERRVTPLVRRKERRYENRFGDTDNTRGATPSWVEEARVEEKGEDRNL